MQSVMIRGRDVTVERKRRSYSPCAAAEAVFKRPANTNDHAVAGAAMSPAAVEHENAYPRGSVGAFIKRGDVTLTAEQAEFLAEHCTHPLQQLIRPLDHPSAVQHIAVLAAIMGKPGAWMDETQIRLGVLDGRLWVMDGNHRLRSQVKAGVPIQWNIKIDAYASEEDFRAAFHQFNTNSRNRTQAQILNAAGFAADHGISRQVATAIYDAMPFIILGFRTGNGGRSDDEILRSRVIDTRMEFAFKFIKEGKKLDECLRKADSRVKRKILVAGVASVALATLKHQPDQAFEFWRGVAKNDGLKKGDPRHTLVMDLLTRNLRHGLAHQSFASPAAAWNAWYEGRSLSIIKVLDADAVRIAGTPYKG